MLSIQLRPGVWNCESYSFHPIIVLWIKQNYFQDTFELQKDAIKPGQKVLIVDDLLATGGSLNGAINLVRQAGGVITEVLVIMELTGLKGRDKIDTKVSSLIEYDD